MSRVLPIAAVVLFLAGCAPSNTDQLQQRAADATAAAKRDAEAISKGVAEGLARKGPVNVNNATDKDLERLPGVTPQVADSIIAKRPYAAARDLVRKRAVTAAEYDRIKNQIVAQ
jgi:DNA uptake protein ComE-like DNA-binding protein